MASAGAKRPSALGVGEELHQHLIPSRASSLSGTSCNGKPRPLSQVVSAESLEKSPRPRSATTSGSARHSLAIGERIFPGFHGTNSTRERSTLIGTRPRFASCFATTREPMHPTKIQRWSGLTRTVNDWDHGLRRVC